MSSDEESVFSNYTDNASNDDGNSSPDTTTCFRNMNLSYFVSEPHLMLTGHFALKDLCLAKGNTEAHYIEGILKYFVDGDKYKGFYHLHQSALANYDDAIYLYGVLLTFIQVLHGWPILLCLSSFLARGHYRKGKKYLDKLEWQSNLSNSDNCWQRIKNSLKSIPVTMKPRYFESMENFEPQSNCRRYDMNEICKDYYYYKMLRQFVQFATASH